jgi:uncharacterized glyoxalase superfamily protein PhnB
MDPNQSVRQLTEIGSTISKAVAMISVPNVKEALAWYESIGFTVLNSFAEEGVVNFGMVSFGKGEIMMKLDEEPGSRPSLWFYTEEVEELYKAFQKRQDEIKPGDRGRIQFAEELNDTFYGARQFGICDPNGYILYFIKSLEK